MLNRCLDLLIILKYDETETCFPKMKLTSKMIYLQKRNTVKSQYNGPQKNILRFNGYFFGNENNLIDVKWY